MLRRGFLAFVGALAFVGSEARRRESLANEFRKYRVTDRLSDDYGRLTALEREALYRRKMPGLLAA